MEKVRVDKLLVDRGLAESRPKAHALVLAGQVFVGGSRVEKPGQAISLIAELEVRSTGPRYASRGGIKLAAALDHFGLEVGGWHCLDVGASTGGFTDCLLQRGAARVVALDVGKHQLEWRLRTDPRVEVRDGVNARYLRPECFERAFHLVTIDLSFISLKKVLPALVPLAALGGHLLALIKPQFEVGKGQVGSGGIVRDPAKHQAVLDAFRDPALYPGSRSLGVIESPITGAEGNREFFLCLAVEAEGVVNRGV